MILPCIDLMDGKVVQLVQGRDKALEGDEPLEMLRKFAAFPEIQVIDLDAAMGKGDNSPIVEMLAKKARCRVGGGVRTAERAAKLVSLGAHRVIVGTAAFTPAMQQIADAVRACLKHAPADKLVFAPDCGLSQTARWAAKKKLASMCAGVEIVKKELGI